MFAGGDPDMVTRRAIAVQGNPPAPAACGVRGVARGEERPRRLE
jgi:hypothetical protein